jgi:hypothetical protein
MSSFDLPSIGRWAAVTDLAPGSATGEPIPKCNKLKDFNELIAEEDTSEASIDNSFDTIDTMPDAESFEFKPPSPAVEMLAIANRVGISGMRHCATLLGRVRTLELEVKDGKMVVAQLKKQFELEVKDGKMVVAQLKKQFELEVKDGKIVEAQLKKQVKELELKVQHGEDFAKMVVAQFDVVNAELKKLQAKK